LFPALEAQIIRCPLAIIVENKVAGVVLVHALGVNLVDMSSPLAQQLGSKGARERYTLVGEELVIPPQAELAVKALAEVAAFGLADHATTARAFAYNLAPGREQDARLRYRNVVRDKAADHVLDVRNEAI